LLLGEFEREGVAFATGDVSQAQRCEEIARFHSNACCFALLLSVGACAEGLNLTVADHCFLLEPQSNVGKELQLVNRINRIGQSRPVTVTKFFCASTVEERLLELRRSKNSGLLASAAAADAGDDGMLEADAMAVPAVDGLAEAGAKMDDLRFILGFR